jgi:hypothetical protein
MPVAVSTSPATIAIRILLIALLLGSGTMLGVSTVARLTWA